MKEVNLVFRLNTSTPYDERFCWSYDGGKTWQSSWLAAEFHHMIKTQVRRFIVDEIRKPNLNSGEELCCVCRNKGKIGIMRFDRYESGSEKIAQVWYVEDVEISGDVSYGVRYRIDRCERCGNEESDYA